MAALAGAWIAVVCGLGGMRDHGGALSFAPRLPSRISKLEFSLLWRGLRVRVDVDRDEVTYSLRDGHDGAELELLHHGEAITVTSDKPVVMSVPPLPAVGPSPRQPWGRAPARRTPEKTS
jgi:alpha,alpha-trehalose phosphorylase